MLCPICKKADASIEVTRSVGGGVVRGFTCGECYDVATSLDARGFYYTFVTLPDMTCPACGMTYGRFLKEYTLGCPHCYKTFEKQLSPLIRSIQKNDR